MVLRTLALIHAGGIPSSARTASSGLSAKAK
jgi:hypothetical protein